MYVALGILASVVLLFLAGIAYQHFASLRDRRIHTAEGRLINIRRGCNLYFFEAGEGQPTVVFGSGIGATHLSWRGIQDEISTLTRTVSYDRAGLGWSSPTRAQRTPGALARELHQMLDAAGVEPPYVLVGHSFGGLVVRRFALLYPREVAGIVLVDPMRPEEWPPLNPARQAQLDLGKRLIRYTIPVARCGLARIVVKVLLGRCGSSTDRAASQAVDPPHRLLRRIRTEARKLPCKVWPALAAHWSRAGFYDGLRNHLVSIPSAVREMHDAEPIRGIPVAVLTPGNADPLTRDQLHRIGDSIRQTLALNSGHWIHLDEPELVINAIRTAIGAPVAPAAGYNHPAITFLAASPLPDGDIIVSARRF
ncbi:MAG: alpha/beta fold hydrolase [Terracidiphilus sp.]